MPYISSSDRELLKQGIIKANNVGHYNYLFSLAYLRIWLKKDNQRYKTIALLKDVSVLPSMLPETDEIEQLLIALGVDRLERETARALAFDEFYRRIGVEYEDLAIDKNGDLPEYQQALDLLFNLHSK